MAVQHAKTISCDFYIGGMEAAMMAGCKLSHKLMTTLQMNSLPSDQLMLLYYKSLLNNSVCMLRCYLTVHYVTIMATCFQIIFRDAPVFLCFCVSVCVYVGYNVLLLYFI